MTVSSDDDDFHIEDCHYLCGFYRKYQVLLLVLIFGDSPDHYVLYWWTGPLFHIVPVIAFVLCHNSSCDILADMMLHILIEDGVATEISIFYAIISTVWWQSECITSCTCLPLSLFHDVTCCQLYGLSFSSSQPSFNLWCYSNVLDWDIVCCAIHIYHLNHLQIFCLWYSHMLAKFVVSPRLKVIHFPALKPSTHCTLPGTYHTT
jgi:hypothetical protein